MSAPHTLKYRTIFWMAWRNMAVRRRGGGLSFMTVVSIGGVALGVATLIIVLSVMAGFEADLTRKMLNGEPHLEMFAENARAGFSLKKISLETLRGAAPEATNAVAFTKADVVLKHRKSLQSAELIGIDPQAKNDLWVFHDTITDGKLADLGKLHTPVLSAEKNYRPLPGVVLGNGLANNLNVDIGDEVMLINPAAVTDSSVALSAGTTSRPYVVVGIFHSGVFNFDSKWAVVNLAEGRRFMADYDADLDAEEYVSAVAFNLKDPFAADMIGARLASSTGLQPVSWMISNKSMLFALKLEKFTMGSILMLVVMVAAFSISGTMMMTVFHRRTQVSLLRAVGMTKGHILKLYLSHGCGIGVVGLMLGLAGGLAICWLISRFRFIDLPQGVYYLKTLPVRYIPEAYVVICVCAWLFSLLASAYPAYTAAKQDPSAGLRNE